MSILKAKEVTIVPPNRPLIGSVELPGSKSITNRALLIAALSRGESVLSGVLLSDDTNHMMAALKSMGVEITHPHPTTLNVLSNGELSIPPGPLFLGNAGTATRFLTAAAVLANGAVVIDGDRHMRKRPIQPLVEALRSLGVEVDCETGCPPVIVHGRGSFEGTHVQIDANLSSQYVSAVLILAACGRHPVEVSLLGADIGGRGYIDLTLAVMKSFGAEILSVGDNRWKISPTRFCATSYKVEPDASACTYLWAAEALTGGRINLGDHSRAMSQPDAESLKLINLFPRMPSVIDGSQMQDAIPTLAALAVFNESPVRFSGIANLRVKECDRIRALSEGLSHVREGLAFEVGDDLIVHGDPSLRHSNNLSAIDSWDDHRIAMSLSLLGLRIEGITIGNPGCVSKTFPAYWDTLAALGVELRPRD